MSTTAQSEPRSILVFCLAGIGDTIMATPTLHALKRSFPRARLAAITMLAGARDVLGQHPDLDELLHFDFLKEGIWNSLRFMHKLRQREFDVAIATYPSNRLEYSLLLWLTGATKKVGHRYHNLDLLCGNFLKNLALLEDNALTNIEENLALVRLLGGNSAPSTPPQVFLNETHREFARVWLDDHGVGDKRLIGFHPGGDTKKNHVKKRWPTEKFTALGKALTADDEITILLFGGPGEEEVMNEIASSLGNKAVSVATETFSQTCALLERCTHFVSNDSGLMHAAGALGVPTTAIFGPTNPVWAKNPWAKRTEVSRGLSCQPCFYYSPRHLCCQFGDFRCIAGISVEEALFGMRQTHVPPVSACSSSSETYPIETR